MTALNALSSSRGSGAWRWLTAAAILVLSLTAAVVVTTLPREGSVRGVVRDVRTGLPLAHAMVWIIPAAGSDSGGELTHRKFGAVLDWMGGKTAPGGWAQGNTNDAADDFAGADRSPGGRTAMTDSRGRFHFAHVPAGECEMYASLNGYDDAHHEVFIVEGQTADEPVLLAPSTPDLHFSTSVHTWLPREPVETALRGFLHRPVAAMELQRLDRDPLLRSRPDLVLNTYSGYGGDEISIVNWSGPTQLVRRWTQKLAPGDDQGTIYQRIRPGALPAGVYRISAHSPEASDNDWFIVTRLALVSKVYGSTVLAYVVDQATGRPEAGAAVRLWASPGKGFVPLSSGVTDADGIVRLPLTGAPPESSGVLVARQGDSVAGVHLELNSPGSSAGSSADSSQDSSQDVPAAAAGTILKAYVYTDRPLYRPGDTVNIKGIARWYRPAPAVPGRSPAYTIPAGQPVTLTIRDARETVVSRQHVVLNDMGSFSTSLGLSPETLTGGYTIRAEINGQHQNGYFAVASYRKPESEAKIIFSRSHYVRGDTIRATISATYFFGVPAAGARAHVTVDRQSGVTDESSDDSSDDISDSGNRYDGRSPRGLHEPEGASGTDDVSAEAQDSGEPFFTRDVVLDKAGRAIVTLPTQIGRGTDPEEGTMSYDFTATIKDISGTGADAEGSVTVAQGTFSLRTLTSPRFCRPGDRVDVEVTARTDSGRPLVGQPESITASYQTWDGDHEVLTPAFRWKRQSGSDGMVKGGFRAAHAGLLIVRAESEDPRGNVVWDEAALWISQDLEEAPDRFPDLSATLDRRRYGPGAVAHLLINTRFPGPTALVTVEGATLYQAWTVPLRRHSTAITIPVLPGYLPQVTVSVCAVHGKQYSRSSTHLRLQDYQHELKVLVRANRDRYHPREPVTVTIHTSDRAGRAVPAELSASVVDSSIFALQGDLNGPIGAAFGPDQPDGVDTADSCERVYLGDVDKGAVDINVRKKFPDTALWLPFVRTGADGNAVVHFQLPDNLTTWRVTCTGHTRDTLTGSGRCNLVVGKDLLVRLITPAFLVAGDTSTFAAIVHNNTTAPLHVHYRLKLTGVSSTDPAAGVIDAAPGAPSRVEWKVNPTAAGTARATVLIAAGRLDDGLEEAIPVLPHGVRSDTWQAGSTAGTNARIEKTVTVDPAAIRGSTVLRIRLAPTVSSALLPALDYLAAYPYGSTDAAVDTLAANTALRQAAARGAIPVDSTRRRMIADMAGRSVLRLLRFQHDDGGWGWFTTGSSSLWMTAYAAWGLTMARDAGIPVDRSMLGQGTSVTLKLANEEINARYPDSYALALAAAALARSGHPADAGTVLGVLDLVWRMKPETRTFTSMAIAAVAAHERGDGATAQALLRQLESGLMKMGGVAAWPERPRSPAMGAAQDPPDAETTAWGLTALEALDPSNSQIDAAARWLMENRRDDHWSSTRATTAAILALTGYLARAHEMNPQFTARILCNGRLVGDYRFDQESLQDPDRVIALPGAALAKGRNHILIEKVGPGRLYYTVELEQMRLAPPARLPALLPVHWVHKLLHPDRFLLPPAPSGLRIRRAILRTTSRRDFFWEDTTPAPEIHFNAGEGIVVRLIIDAVRPVSHIIIEEPLPAGAHASIAPGSAVEYWDNWWDYTDVRDDRIVFFVGDLPRGEHEIDYHLQAETAGVYDVLPTLLTGSFDPTVHATGSVSRITVES